MTIQSNKLYLLTGGSGFLGEALTRRITQLGGNIRVLARGEGKLIELKQKFPNIEIYIGDIADPFTVKQAMKGVDAVFHLAASKHVGLAEKFARESVNTNVIGSINIFNQSLKQGLDFVVSISTDKAVQVSGVYGATKLLMERLVKQYQVLNPTCAYRTVRYGNVLYSTGSVLCKWRDLIEKGEEVVITDPEATRFFWTVEQAVDHIFECLEEHDSPEPYIPVMRGMAMGDLLEAMIEKYSGGKPISIKMIGLQPGENKHERISEEGLHSGEVSQFSVEEIIKMI